MSSQTVHEFRAPAAETALASSAPYYVPGTVVSISDSPTFSRTAEEEQVESNPDGLGCARGIHSAFLIAAGIVLLAYGIRYLWHLAH